MDTEIPTSKHTMIGSISSSVLVGNLSEWLPNRLRYTAFLAVFALSILLIIELFRTVTYVVPSYVQFGILFLGILFSFFVAWLTTYNKISAEKLEFFGLFFEVIISLIIWVIEFTASFEGIFMTPGIPTVCSWLILYPLIVPSSPKKTALAALIAVALGPLVFFSFVHFGTQVVPANQNILFFWFLAAFVSSLFAVFVSHHINQVKELISSAQDLGRYHLNGIIGKGGMGEVWHAEHKFVRRPVAIKMIRKDRIAQKEGTSFDDAVTRFRLEAETTANLRSPHTIELYDFGETIEGDLYYVMEYLDGVDLQELVDLYGPQPPARVVHFLIQICESLEEAHRAGLVHRDIKPGNIMTCRAGIVEDYIKVLDFGTVRAAFVPPLDAPERLTQIKSVVGTPGFMAPEAMLGDAEIKSDLYSLGCVAYWLLTGLLVAALLTFLRFPQTILSSSENP